MIRIWTNTLATPLNDMAHNLSAAGTNVSLLDGTNTFTAVATATAGWKATNTATVYLPATSAFTYDLNGNLLSDAVRHFEYDDENQLTAVTQSNAWRSEFVYDGKMHRQAKEITAHSPPSTN